MQQGSWKLDTNQQDNSSRAVQVRPGPNALALNNHHFLLLLLSLHRLQDLFAAPKTLLYAANGSLIAILVCDAEENLGMARLQLSAMMDFVMSKSKGLDADPFQLAGQLDVLEAYILQHFPSGLLIFENTRVAAQLTKQATTSLKT
eukprot:TRINITY_DN12053_c0_g2_i2.p2 TRINITY_DN12053_c0_g2~~TRINITY_DN12053_c0_g2_i2.p2  ORF type:complete len:146 (+),score=31.28 TRINITY_DN12053_c0_g2_i2:43-480(+)